MLLSDTFALANLFEVIESNVGVIGACLPILRAPLTQWLPQWFPRKRSTARTSRYYHDDRFTNEYVLQNVSGKQQDSHMSRHEVFVAGGKVRSDPRRSDELGIIDMVRASPEFGVGALPAHEAHDIEERYDYPHAIKKNVSVSVRRT